MSPKAGRPLAENPKNVRLEIRLTKQEEELLQSCADEMRVSRSKVILEGIKLVREELDKRK